MTYQHKQLGFVTISIFVVAFLFFVDLLTLSIVFMGDDLPAYVNPLLITFTLLMIILGVLFSSLNIQIADGQISWHFGPGFWKNKAELAQISSVQAVQNRWWYGWGIRRIKKGWLYNVSGMSAVEVQLSNGQLFRLGSDEPEQLAAAIQEAIKVEA